jgi:formate hydrogenlyase transcriptional activator
MIRSGAFGDKFMQQTKRQLASHPTAELFYTRDFRHRQETVGEQYGRAASEQKRESNCVQEEPPHFPQDIDSSQLDEDIFGCSEALLPALVHVPAAAATDCTVLINGEVGTGTESVARAIHKLSRRSPRAFLRVDCEAIPPLLITPELFGRQRGSGSQATQPRPGHFQLAEGGTIVLEGIEDLSAKAQLALLRILQEIEAARASVGHSVRSNVRLIAVANHDLRAAVLAGAFRSDLFHLLNILPIKVLPLRERKKDIPVLAQHFLTRYARRAGKKLPRLTPPDMDLLKSYPWPSNILELRCVMERFVDLCEAERLSIDAKLIPREFRISIQPTSGVLIPNQRKLLEVALMEMIAGWSDELDYAAVAP